MPNIKKQVNSKEFYLRCAELFKIMSNPKRLEILDIIKDKEITVNIISKQLGTRKSNTSQHLAYLRYTGIVKARRQGKNIYYKLLDSRIIETCKILSEVKFDNILS